MMEVVFYNPWLSLGTLEVRTQVHQHFWFVVRPSASNSIALHILVQVFIGVQFWAARWQRKHSNSVRMPFRPAFETAVA